MEVSSSFFLDTIIRIMSCYLNDEGYYRRSGCFGYGFTNSIPGFGSIHTGYRSQSCCPGGLGVLNPRWERLPCGNVGGIAGCFPGNNPYSWGTVITSAGCGTNVGTNATGIAIGPYVAPCGPYLIR